MYNLFFNMFSVDELTDLIMVSPEKNMWYFICSIVCFVFWQLNKGYDYLYKIMGVKNENNISVS